MWLRWAVFVGCPLVPSACEAVETPLQLLVQQVPVYVHTQARSSVPAWPGTPAETLNPPKRQPQLLVSGGALVREGG